MNIEHYDKFKRLHILRRDAEAKAAMEEFIGSFHDDERQAWTRWFLENEPFGHKIRHELYRDLIFPTLKAAYDLRETWAYRELARTAQNLYSARDLWDQVEHKTAGAILRELLTLDPADRAAQQMLLQENLNGLRNAVHEWPTGILFGLDGASLDECEQLLVEVKESTQWTSEQATLEFLCDVESKIRFYMDRLRNR